jgi:virginiamycin A acetyltransferase
MKEPQKSIYIKDNITHPNVEVGDYTYGPDLKIFGTFPESPYKVKIGKFCSIAEGVQLHLHTGHRNDWVTTYPFSRTDHELWPEVAHLSRLETVPAKGDIIVGNDVWIGTDVKILSGVTIGDGAVIGAGAIVTKDVPPYAIAVGSPARVVKKRFDDAMIEKLLKIQWWHWPVEKIRENLLLLHQSPEAFVKKRLMI